MRDAALVLQLRTLEEVSVAGGTHPNRNKNSNNSGANQVGSADGGASALGSLLNFKDQLAVALGGVGLRGGTAGNGNAGGSVDAQLQHRQLQSERSARNSLGDGGGGGESGGTVRASVDGGGEEEQAAAHEDGSFTYRGQRVRVKERVRVGNQDPALMAALAKLSALEHHIAVNRNSLQIVMGRDGLESEESDDDDDDDDD